MSPEGLMEWYVNLYCETTGFPNTVETSRKMLDHAREAIKKAEVDTQMQVLASIYYPDSSVGFGTALPGSDIDGWMILVEEASHAEPVIERIKHHLNPELVSLGSIYPEAAITIDELQKYGSLAEAPKRDRRGFYTAIFLSRYLKGDSTIVEAITPELEQYLTTLPLAQNKEVPADEAKVRPNPRLIPKYIARRQLQNKFESLSTTERYLTIHSIRRARGFEIPARFYIDDANEFKNELLSLCQKGVLNLEDWEAGQYASGIKYITAKPIEE